METVTTPSRLKAAPSYQGELWDPEDQPPPWIHTRTGSRAPVRPGAGVKTLRVRKSSPGTEGSGMAGSSKIEPRWGVADGVRAGRSAAQGARGTGARKRRSPLGASA